MSEKTEENQQLTDKEARCVEYYTDPKSDTYHNWSKSYLKAEYSQCHGWQRNAAKVRIKNYIRTAIEAKRAEYGVKSDITREYCVEKLQDIAETTDNERTCIQAMSLIGEFCGFKRESAPNAERVAAKRAAMSEEERKLARTAAKMRTDEESGEAEDAKPEVKTIKVGNVA